MTLHGFSKTIQVFSIMLISSFSALTSSIFNTHFSTNSLFKAIQAFSVIHLKILPASTHSSIPKPLPHFYACVNSSIPFSVPKLYWFPVPAVTDYQKLSDLKKQKFILYSSGGQKSKSIFTRTAIKIPTGSRSCKLSRGESIPCLFQLPVAGGIPWLLASSF